LTLVEVLVALVILELGLGCVFAVMLFAERRSERAHRMELAVSASQSILDSLAAGAAAGAGSRGYREFDLEWSVDSSGVTRLHARAGQDTLVRVTGWVPSS
jgi:Tfp pilus assembly protein PilV